MHRFVKCVRVVLRFFFSFFEIWSLRQQIDEALSEKLTALRRRLENVVMSTAARRWCIYEWFYASCDYSFFSQNEFNTLLLELGEANVSNDACECCCVLHVACLNSIGVLQRGLMMRSAWAALRRRGGRPRRLSVRLSSSIVVTTALAR